MRSRYLELLRLLDRHGVEHMVVGGVAAILAGAPVTTLDLDLLYERSPENLERLATTMEEIDARYRDPAGRDVRPTLERLTTLRIHLLLTTLGPLDLLSAIGEAWSFADLVSSSTVREVDDLRVRVLSLEKLIEVKERTGRAKDLAMLPILRRTLRLRSD